MNIAQYLNSAPSQQLIPTPNYQSVNQSGISAIRYNSNNSTILSSTVPKNELKTNPNSIQNLINNTNNNNAKSDSKRSN